MASIATPVYRVVPPAVEPVAPWWHTVLVMLPIAIGSVASGYQNGLPNAHVSGADTRLSIYLTVMVIEWLPALLIWLVWRRRGSRSAFWFHADGPRSAHSSGILHLQWDLWRL
jgi:hypothetical protein